MNIIALSPEYGYWSMLSGQKRFYKLTPIPFLELPTELQEAVRKIEDNE